MACGYMADPVCQCVVQRLGDFAARKNAPVVRRVGDRERSYCFYFYDMEGRSTPDTPPCGSAAKQRSEQAC